MAINIVGNNAAETFQTRGVELSGGAIDGGGGIDVLELRDFLYPETFDFTTLKTFQNLEVIRAVIEVAKIRIRADQLAGITTIDSDGSAHRDEVTIVGAGIDLRGKTFVGNLAIIPETANADIQVSDFATASLIRPTVRGIHVRVQEGTLTLDQRVALFDQGIDKITDASGTMTMTSGPVLTALQGDVVTFKTGAETMLDLGLNATLSADSHLKSLVVKFIGTKSFFDLLDIEVGLHLKLQAGNPAGMNKIFFDNVEIGTVFRETFEGSLHFSFNGSATTGHVQEIIRSISYSYNSSFSPSSGVRNVEFTLEDAGGRKTTALSTVKIDEVKVPPTTPNTGSSLIVGTDGADLLKGGSGNDTLSGGAGNDQLHGRAGKDMLTGGSGNDFFVFSTQPGNSNIDRITDFSVKDDTIWLENDYFTKLGKKAGMLKKSYFFKGAKAHDKDDYIIYDPKKGALYYDQDGSKAGKAVQIAALKTKLAMTYKDFLII
jgi:hypothetical protein